MRHRTYRRLGHRALGLLPFGRDERALLAVVFVASVALKGLLFALAAITLVAVLCLAHRQARGGRLNHLRAAVRQRRPIRYARRAPDPLRRDP